MERLYACCSVCYSPVLYNPTKDCPSSSVHATINMRLIRNTCAIYINMHKYIYCSLFSVPLVEKGARNMRSQPTFLRFLQTLPSTSIYLRLSIFFGGFLICGVFMILGLIVTNNRGLTPIFAIPVALAAWMFRPRQAALAIGSIFLMLIIINTLTVRSLHWPFPLFMAFLCGIVAALTVAGGIIV